MGKKSRNKGAGFERKVALILSDWWGMKFSRTPASGGLRWGTDNRVAGDIVSPPESQFPFTIECKKQEDWDFSQALVETGKLKDWWEQCINDAERVGKIPLLIFSKNYAPNYFMMYDEDYDRLFSDSGSNYLKTKITIQGDTRKVSIGLLDELTNIGKDTVIKLFK